MSSSNKENLDTSWLNLPATGKIKCPVETNIQTLPFENLSWEDFEKLCYRLVKKESNIDFCSQYGVPGDNQHGIDIFSREDDFTKYRVYQCKNENRFGPKKIKNAVNKFKNGEWYDKSDTLILCTRENLRAQKRIDAIEEANIELKKDNKTLLPWDGIELTDKLKLHPELVDDFFGRSWVRVFLGKECAEKLGDRLDVDNVNKLRVDLFDLYNFMFSRHDPGIPIPKSIPFIQRCIVPDVQDIFELKFRNSSEFEISEQQINDEFRSNDSENRSNELRDKQIPKTQYYKQRTPFQNWITKNSKNLIIGEPGSGKTTVMRFLALDLLSEKPILNLIVDKWGGYIPIWIPFAMWTRMISENAEGVGIEEIIERWLKAWNAQKLIPFVKQALKDKRLLLLVDGLDEYSDRSSAQIALNHLEYFLNQNSSVAIIATTRPNGYSKLGKNLDGWIEAEIAKLSSKQQQKLTSIWFYENSKKLSPKLEDSKREFEVQKQTDTFICELSRSHELKNLSTNPLLLSLLIYLQISHLRLPLSRFNAYDSLIDHLISDHPLSRKVAAEISEQTELTNEDIKYILANLAYNIHLNFTEGIIEEEKAKNIVTKFLKDEQLGFGMDHNSAIQTSKKTVLIAEDELGLIVKKTNTGIGFYHRILQEYLASYHLFRLGMQERKNIISNYCIDSQWKEVILGLFQINKRPEDVKNWTNLILEKRKISTLQERLLIDELISEIIFGDFNCPPNLAKRLSTEIFSQIDNNYYLPNTEILLKNVLNGLSSSSTKKIVQDKLKDWFPNRAGLILSSIFKAMRNWSVDDELINTLFLGMKNEDDESRKSASVTLGNIAKNRDWIKKRLIENINNTFDQNFLISCVDALLICWEDYNHLPEILNRLTNSQSNLLKLYGIKGKVKLKIHNENDLDTIIKLGNGGIDLFSYREEIQEIILNGWPQSEKVKKVCFDSVYNQYNHKKYFDSHSALIILLKGFPKDEDVVEYCVQEIKTQQYPFIGIEQHIGFRLLSQNFQGNKKLVAALDEWVLNSKYKDIEKSFAALVGSTDVFKKELIKDLNKAFPHWPARGLLEGWGMSDPEVRDALLNYVNESIRNACSIGHLLPEIIKDNKKCRKLLLNILQSPECNRHDFVISGLIKLGVSKHNADVVDISLPILHNHSDIFTDSFISNLIMHYNFDPRVKEYVYNNFNKKNAPLSAIAYSFGNDPCIRKKIIKVVTPLPDSLRLIIAKYFIESETEKEFALELLSSYDLEENAQVKIQAAISYHTILKSNNVDLNLPLEKLKNTLLSSGHDYNERRCAAFCGLTLLDRLDIMTGLKEPTGSGSPVGIQAISGFQNNIPLIQFLLKHWDYLIDQLKEEFWKRIFGSYSKSFVWQNLAQFADSYETPKQNLLQFLSDHTTQKGNSNILFFIARVAPKSNLLWNYCINTIGLGNQNDSTTKNDINISISHADIFNAINLIRINFGEDETYLKKINFNKSQNRIENLIILLLEVWPDSDILKALYNKHIKPKKKISIYISIRIHSIKANRVRMFLAIKWIIRFCAQESRHIEYEALYMPVVRRLQKDNILVNLLQKYIRISTNPSIRISIARLVHKSVGLTPELKNELNMELSYQLSNEIEFAFDIIAGDIVSVPYSILEMLDKS